MMGIAVVVVTLVDVVVGANVGGTTPFGECDANDVSDPVAPEPALGVVVVVVADTDGRVPFVVSGGFGVAAD